MKTKNVATILLSMTLGVVLIFGAYHLSKTSEETSPTPSPVSQMSDAADELSASPLDAVAGSPAVARPLENSSRPNSPNSAADAAVVAPRPVRNSVNEALSDIESRLASSTGGDRGEAIRREDVRFTHPTKLEKEDNVSVGVVFSVGDDGIDVEGKGIKSVFKKIFDEDEEEKD